MTSQYQDASEAMARRAVAAHQGFTFEFALAVILINLQRKVEAIQPGNPNMTPALVADWLENDPGTFISEEAARFDEAQLAVISGTPTRDGLQAEVDRLRGLAKVQRIAAAIERA